VSRWPSHNGQRCRKTVRAVVSGGRSRVTGATSRVTGGLPLSSDQQRGQCLAAMSTCDRSSKRHAAICSKQYINSNIEELLSVFYRLSQSLAVFRLLAIWQTSVDSKEQSAICDCHRCRSVEVAGARKSVFLGGGRSTSAEIGIVCCDEDVDAGRRQGPSSLIEGKRPSTSSS